MPRQARKAQKTPAFVEDLFIVAWKDSTKKSKVVYHVPERVWKKLTHLVESDVSNTVIAQLLPLLRSEVVVANVPASDKEEPCYLTDLTAIAINVD